MLFIYNALNEYLELQKQGLITENTQRKLAKKYLLSYSSIRDLINQKHKIIILLTQCKYNLTKF